MRKITLAVLVLISIKLFSQNINISQIDSSSMLFNQKVDLYLQITDNQGNPLTGLTKNNILLSESIDDSYFFNNLEVVSLEEGINKINGINFLLLIDNSGSMYRTLDGKETDDKLFKRITIAKDAIRKFVSNSIDVKDTISLASFNSNYTFHSDDIRSDGLTILNSIVEPDEESNKTELYRSLVGAIEAFSRIKGRKVVIVLSDGKNVFADENNPYNYSDTINEYLKEGISLYAINYAGEADKNLIKITTSTGGNIFEALDAAQLNSVYDEIKSQILKEYKLTYKATMLAGDRRFVSVKLDNLDSTPVTRVYFSSNVFGNPSDRFSILFFVLALLAIVLLISIRYIKFEKLNKLANLEILQAAPGVTISDDTISLTKNETVIGGSNSADLTITGEADNQNDFATIVYDDNTKNYKVISSETILVNNQVTTERALEAGDVINIGGTTIVFDDDIKQLVKKED